jgi:hypothetical protein
MGQTSRPITLAPGSTPKPASGQRLSPSGCMLVCLSNKETNHGTHSLRRTKAVLIYRRTGNLRAVQLLLGHSKIEHDALPRHRGR